MSAALAAQAPQLPPSTQPIGVFPNYITKQSETLVLKERVLSLSGDSFSIKTVDGRAIFQIKGEALSLSGRKNVADVQGNPLFVIRKEHFHLHSTYKAEDPSGNKFFEVASKFSILKSKAVAKFTSSHGKEESLTMKGGFFDRSAEIVDDSTQVVVARIDRQFLNASELLFGQQTYAVTIAPGVDMALIVAMCVCLDELNNEK